MASSKTFRWLFFWVAFLFGGVLRSSAQNWFVQGKPFVKIQITKSGFYTVNCNLLQQTGLNIIGANPKHLRGYIWGQPIALETPNNTALLPTDLIGFYVPHYLPNPADSVMYGNYATDRLNPFSAIFNDTISVFIYKAETEIGFLGIENGSLPDVGQSKVPEIWRKIYFSPKTQYVYGRGGRYAWDDDFNRSDFVAGEGWASASVNNTVFNIDFEGTISKNMIEVGGMFVGLNGNMARCTLSARQPNSTFVNIDTITIFGKNPAGFSDKYVVPNLIGQTATQLRLINTTINTNIVYGNLWVSAPTSATWSGNETFLFETRDSAQAIELLNPPTSPLVYNITNPYMPIALTPQLLSSPQRLRLVVSPNYASKTKYIALSEKIVVTPEMVQLVGFPLLKKIKNTNTIVIISSKINYSSAKKYGEYRGSLNGGNYDTLLVTIEELANTFTYGQNHPLAIRKYLQYACSGGYTPKALILFGRGIALNNRINPFSVYNPKHDLLPTYGAPPSDAWYGKLDSLNGLPKFAVGRIPSNNNEQINGYIDKVKTYEATDAYSEIAKTWLFGSGGRTQTELTKYKDYCEAFAQKVTDGDYKAGISEFVTRVTNQPIEPLNVAEYVNDGLNGLVLFGHASRNGSDIELGFATQPASGVDNTGKYPFLLINGCFAGDCFAPDSAFTQDWVMANNKGAIAAVAHADYALDTDLKRFMDAFLATQMNDSIAYGATLGDVLLKALTSLWPSNPVIRDSAFFQQMTLIGDPLIRLNRASKPDFSISPSEVFFPQVGQPNNPEQVFKFVLKNFGRTQNDSIDIVLVEEKPDGSEQTTRYKLEPLKRFSDTVTLKFISSTPYQVGYYNYTLTIDPLQKLNEANYLNNKVRTSVILTPAGPNPVYPAPFAIVATDTVRLWATTSHISNQAERITFEVSKTELFNNPQRYNTEVVQTGSRLITLSDLGTVTDSSVYFWRIVHQVTGTISNVSSFTFIRGSVSGRSQSFVAEFKNNQYEGLRIIGNSLEFIPDTLNLELVASSTANTSKLFKIEINGVELTAGSNTCNIDHNNSVYALAIDSRTLNPYRIPFGNELFEWQYACGRNPRIVNFFPNNPNGSPANLDSYLGQVGSNDYLILSCSGNINFEKWNPSTLALLLQFGINAQKFSNLKPGDAFIIIGRKQSPIIPALQLQTTNGQTVPQTIGPFDTTIIGVPTPATITTPILGPAKNWGAFFVNHPPLSVGQQLQYQMLSAQQQVIVSPTSSAYSLSELNNKKISNISLKGLVTDTIGNKPPIIKRWLLTFNEAPEGYLTVANNYQPPTKIARGQLASFPFAFTSINNQNFDDSLKVIFTLMPTQSGKTIRDSIKIAPPKAFNKTNFIIQPNSADVSGKYILKVEVNPGIVNEVTYLNNSYNTLIEFEPDNTPPIFEVTFDGRRITNGELVSSQPTIEFRLTDENTFISLSRTYKDYWFSVKNKNTGETTTYKYGDPLLELILSPPNKVEGKLSPGRLPDGIYTFEAYTTDGVGNKANNNGYKIDFEVINQLTITQIVPYPNPFSTKCKFVFTITGNQPPADLMIKIYTVGGRLIRELTTAELGPLRIGYNITDGYWDGTDNYGENVAAGLYLYTAEIKANGEGFKHRQTNADQYFKSGFGKIYLIK